MEEIAKGYTCACGKFHKFNGYVYAHWNIQLVHVCACGRENKIKGGIAEISNLPNKACNGRGYAPAQQPPKSIIVIGAGGFMANPPRR